MQGRHESAGSVAPAILLPEVIRHVLDAGALMRVEFHRRGGPRGHGYAAAIDKEIEALLRERLMGLHKAGWLGEETGRLLSTSPDTWIVDPNDGTKAFNQRIRGSSISVALLRSGRPVLGVVYAPTAPDDSGDLFTWAEGLPLMRNGKTVGNRGIYGSHTIVAMNEEAADYAEANGRVLTPARFVAVPSIAYRLALAAAGEVDAAAAVGALALWDIAGGHALLTGAGLHLVDVKGGAVTYDESNHVKGCIGGHRGVVRDLVAKDLTKAVGGPRVPRRGAHPVRRVNNPLVLSRAQGVLLGQFAGDALGSAVEFCSPSEIAAKHLRGLLAPVDNGRWQTIAGQPTDDSEMALALARTIVSREGFDEKDVAAAYVKWFRSGPFDCGATIGSALRARESGNAPSRESEANGALMRVSPVGILRAGKPRAAAAMAMFDAMITHPTPVCLASSAAYAAAISAGVSGGDREAMWAAAYSHCGSSSGATAVQERLMLARQERPTSYSGWVLNALQNAFYFLMSGASLADAVIQTAAMGEDSDTNAAICGALLGAVEGREGVPVEWRNLVLSCRPLEALGHTHPRPMPYWPDDALDLAEALLATGFIKEN